jgi:hypothetical protein
MSGLFHTVSTQSGRRHLDGSSRDVSVNAMFDAPQLTKFRPPQVKFNLPPIRAAA